MGVGSRLWKIMLDSKIVPWLTPLLFFAVSARFGERQAHGRLVGDQVNPERPGGDFRELRGAGRCEQNSDCRRNAPHCSKWGFCQRSAQFGSRPLLWNPDGRTQDPNNQPTDQLKPFNKHFIDNSEYTLSEEYTDYDYSSEFGHEYEYGEDYNVVKRNLGQEFEENLDVVSIPQRFIAPQPVTENSKSVSSFDQHIPVLGSVEDTEELEFSHFLAESGGGLERESRLPLVLLPPPVLLPPKVTPVAEDQIQRNNQDTTTIDEDEGAKRILVAMKEETDVPTKCPGGSIKECVFACVPLPELHVYGLCVHECADRCPQTSS